MNMFLDYLKGNKIYVLLAAMVLLSVFAVTGQGQNAYYAAMLLVFIVSVAKFESFDFLYLLLPLWLFISSIVNGVFDNRFFTFVLMIACATPMISSYKGYVFRSKVLFAIYMSLPVVTLLNLYAYRAGINYFLILNENVSDLNFSGFLLHPMWLSAINGASNVMLLYLFYKMRDSKWFIRYGILLLLLASIYLSVIAASRSALASSMIAMAAMVYFYSDSGAKFVKNGVIIVILASILLPYYKSGGEQMRVKMENTENSGNSRQGLWNQRIQEFEESPFMGMGYATAHDQWGNVVTGTVETGSGWLTILSQSGLIGAFIVFFMLKRAYVSIEEISERKGLLVIFGCEFIYLCAHSCFEGYLYTAGYCPSLMFWLTLSFFADYNKYDLPLEDEEDDADNDVENLNNEDNEDDEDEEERDFLS